MLKKKKKGCCHQWLFPVWLLGDQRWLKIALSMLFWTEHAVCTGWDAHILIIKRSLKAGSWRETRWGGGSSAHMHRDVDCVCYAPFDLWCFLLAPPAGSGHQQARERVEERNSKLQRGQALIVIASAISHNAACMLLNAEKSSGCTARWQISSHRKHQHGNKETLRCFFPPFLSSIWKVFLFYNSQGLHSHFLQLSTALASSSDSRKRPKLPDSRLSIKHQEQRAWSLNVFLMSQLPVECH